MSQPTTNPATPTNPAGPAASAPKGDAKGNGKAKRGRPAGADAKVWNYEGLDVALLDAPQNVSQELASLAAPTRARDERQVAIDKVVHGLHAQWITAGRPEKWAAMPKASYHVPPQAEDTLTMLVRRAASFHGVSAKFGKSVRDGEGRAIVVFAIRDSRKRAAKSDAPEGTFTVEDLREFLTEFYADNEDAIEDFLRAWDGDDESPEDNGAE